MGMFLFTYIFSLSTFVTVLLLWLSLSLSIFSFDLSVSRIILAMSFLGCSLSCVVIVHLANYLSSCFGPVLFFVNSWTWHIISADARGFKSFSSRLECSFLFLAWVLRFDLLILYWVEVGKWPSSPCSWFLRKCFVITDAHCGFSRLYYIGWFPSIASLFRFLL